MENNISDEELEKALAYVCHFVRDVRATPIEISRVKTDAMNLSLFLYKVERENIETRFIAKALLSTAASTVLLLAQYLTKLDHEEAAGIARRG